MFSKLPHGLTFGHIINDVRALCLAHRAEFVFPGCRRDTHGAPPTDSCPLIMRINSAMRLLISTDVHEDGASSPRDFKYWVDSALVIDETLLWSDDIRELDLRGRLSGRAISLRKSYGHHILINPLSGIHVIRSIMLIMIRRVIVHQLLD